MISYLWRALRLSQIVFKVGATTAAGFFADFAVGGGLVGFDFLDLFNCASSRGLNFQLAVVAYASSLRSQTYPAESRSLSGKPDAYPTSILRQMMTFNEGDLTQSEVIGVQCDSSQYYRRFSPR